MKKSIKFFCLSVFLYCSFSAQLFATITGSGTESSPYIINNRDDWNTFASNINNGINADKYYKLSDTFDNSATPISDMAGNSESYPFKGVFDGNGRTLTISINGTAKNAAPFRYASGVTIRNLTVTGSITTTDMNGAGFIANVIGGLVHIENCISSVTINSSRAGDGTHGGFIGLSSNDSNVYFLDCAFIGKILGYNTTCCGGFLGYRGGYSVNYKNCLFAPSELTASSSSSATFNRNGAQSLQNCFYTTEFYENQGIDCSSMSNQDLLNNFGDNWEIKNGNVLPVQALSIYLANTFIVTGIQERYTYTKNEIPLSYTVKNANSTLLTKNTHYTIKIEKSSGEIVSTPVEKGIYNLIIQGKGSYKGAKYITFSITYAGAGTEASPYEIESVFDWNTAATDCTGNETFEGKYFKLISDLDFEGDSFNYNIFANHDNKTHTDSNTGVTYHDDVRTDFLFAGTFDGNGHVISGVQKYQGLFSMLSESGTVKNLTLKNSCIKGKFRAGGIVGLNKGKIINCHVTDDVLVLSEETPNSGENNAENLSHGGIAGDNKGGSILGCSSAGIIKLTSSYYNYFGGIAGYNTGTIEACFYYGTSVYSDNGKGAICGSNQGTITNCLHTYSECGAVNSSDIDGAKRAYSISIDNEDVELKMEGLSSYGRIESLSGILLFDGRLYAPALEKIKVSLKYNGGKFDEDKLIYEYKYIAGQQSVVELLEKNEDSSYSVDMPSSDIMVYAGYGWNGEGSEIDPYEIINQYQLEYLGTCVNEIGRNYKDKIFVLKNDINFESNETFIPIGLNNEFCGLFDGQGYSISGLNVTNNANYEDSKCAGFFGRLGKEGLVKNLTIKNSVIKGLFAAGSIAGYNNGSIENCTVSEDVNLVSTNPEVSTYGGIAGYNKGLILNCNAYAKVSCSCIAGGITGYNDNGSVISSRYFETNTSTVNANSYAGFIIGRFEGGTLENNSYIGSLFKGVGSVSSGKDVEGIKKGYKISASSGHVLFADGSEGFEFNGSLYAFKDNLIKIKVDEFQQKENTITGIVLGDEETCLFFDDVTDNVFTFTMPGNDIKVSNLVEVKFVVQDVCVNNTVLQSGAVIQYFAVQDIGEEKVFDGWYKDEAYTIPFDFSQLITENLTLYAKYLNIKNISRIQAVEDPYTPGVFYTTFYSSEKNYKVSSGTKVFYVRKLTKEKLLIEEEKNGIINAKQGVILQSDSPEIYLNVTELNGLYDYENLLSGTDDEVEALEEGSYVIGFNKKGGVAFYKWEGRLEANKAFLFVKEGDNE